MLSPKIRSAFSRTRLEELLRNPNNYRMPAFQRSYANIAFKVACLPVQFLNHTSSPLIISVYSGISNLFTVASKSTIDFDADEFKQKFIQNQDEDPLTLLPLSQRVFNLTDSQHQSVHFDQNVALGQSAPIKLVKCLDDIYPYGTVCRVNFQKLDRNGEQQIFMVLRGQQRARIVKKVNEEDDLLLFSSLESHEMKIQKDTKTFSKMRKLVRSYNLNQKKIKVNAPNLIYGPTHGSTIELISGHLASQSYFSRNEVLTLYNALSFPKRLELCTSYMKRYTAAMAKQWYQLQQKQPEESKMSIVYQHLKKKFEKPKSPFVEKIENELKNRAFPDKIRKILESELNQLKELFEGHPEYNLKRNYIQLLVELPFGKLTNDSYSLSRSRQILEDSHHGMDCVKNRIMEFLAVSKLKQCASGKTLLMVGPPGVGKTSISSSIAECLNRKFARISLGGENDVAIVKGHRRTYMASYPGKIVQALKQCQSENPVILLDEIDKLQRSFKGSIQDALLEVLDPMQNHQFVDNYLEVPIDLSKVLFICSANLLQQIPSTLLDRMELINLSGYTTQDKIAITQNYLIPQILKDTGLTQYNTKISDEVLTYIINWYCRESGVRSLQRTLQRLHEKLVMRVVKHQQINTPLDLNVTIDSLEELLGPTKFTDSKRNTNIPGLGVGLAYNAYGGNLMYIEIANASQKNSKGSIHITGSLGDTIKESVQIAYVHAKQYLHDKFKNTYLDENDLHIHFPLGAVKKDGPSGGIAIAAALVSKSLNKPIKESCAMTGEISLTGQVLKIGGLKEKVLAARREGIKNVIIPEGNKSDWEELAEKVKEGIEIHMVRQFEQVADLLLK